MKKILIPTVDMPIGSEVAYRVADLADSIGADVVVLFVVSSVDAFSYTRGKLAIEIFEEAAQNYSFALDGYIMQGDPSQLIGQMSKKLGVDMILLGSEDEVEFENWESSLGDVDNCPIEYLHSYPPGHLMP